MLSKFIASIKNALFVLRASHQVVVYMRDGAGQVQIITHYAANYDDALEWFFCYPASDYAEIYESTLGYCACIPVASRGTVQAYHFPKAVPAANSVGSVG